MSPWHLNEMLNKTHLHHYKTLKAKLLGSGADELNFTWNSKALVHEISNILVVNVRKKMQSRLMTVLRLNQGSSRKK